VANKSASASQPGETRDGAVEIEASILPRYAPSMSVVCGCPRDALCAACARQALDWFVGPAELRGETWAASVARRRPELLAEPWPELAGRALEMAVGKLVDMTRDPTVVEQLLIPLQRGARRAWARLGGRS
jgi:hypothetical protein